MVVGDSDVGRSSFLRRPRFIGCDPRQSEEVDSVRASCKILEWNSALFWQFPFVHQPFISISDVIRGYSIVFAVPIHRICWSWLKEDYLKKITKYIDRYWTEVQRKLPATFRNRASLWSRSRYRRKWGTIRRSCNGCMLGKFAGNERERGGNGRWYDLPPGMRLTLWRM